MATNPYHFEQFRAENIRRCEEGFGHKFSAPYPEGWSAADWVTAVVGELGELANLLKKRRRGEAIDPEDIAEEWADTFTYLLLLAEAEGIDPMWAARNKFDRVSKRIGWKG